MAEHIFGMYDAGAWVGAVREAGKTAWCIYTEAIGHSTNDRSGKNFAQPEITAVVRLNNGYGSGGTIPLPAAYSQFARRCANYVAASQGIDYVIIGNEPQMAWDWPEGQAISLDNYMDCYLQCYRAIKGVAPQVRVGPAPVATWNNGMRYAGNERGDWIGLQADIWTLAKESIDALYIHAYSHGYAPELLTNPACMGPPFADRYYHFAVYRQFMAAVPPHLRHLPVLITEMNGDCEPVHQVAWPHHNTGWVQAAYAELARWNQSGAQQIFCGALFRWQPGDHKWTLSDKAGALDDFRQALRHDYRHGYQQSLPERVPGGREGSDGTDGATFAQGEMVRVTASAGLNLRAVPVDGEVLTQLPLGTLLQVLEQRGEWLHVVHVHLARTKCNLPEQLHISTDALSATEATNIGTCSGFGLSRGPGGREGKVPSIHGWVHSAYTESWSPI